MNETSMIKSTVTSKRQITVPKEICEFLNINEGDKVIFKMENNKIIFDVENENCFACNGIGKIDNNECFVCQGEGRLPKAITKDILFIIGHIGQYTRKYKINYQFSVPNDDFPSIKFKGESYDPNKLAVIQDKLQKMLIRKVVPKSIQNKNLLCIPSSKILKLILDTLVTETAKKEVSNWFIIDDSEVQK